MLITAPPPERAMAGMPWRQPRKVPKRSSLMTRQNSSSGASTTEPSCGVDPPALLCSTSSRPNRSTVARIASRTLVSSVTSARSAKASLPASRAVSPAAAASMSAATTRAPSRAKSTAVARPIPAPAPVMNATLPCSLPMVPPNCESKLEREALHDLVGAAGGVHQRELPHRPLELRQGLDRGGLARLAQQRHVRGEGPALQDELRPVEREVQPLHQHAQPLGHLA